MERIALGDSGIMVSKLCFGTGTIARREGWGPEAAEAMVDLIRFVLDRGCNKPESNKVMPIAPGWARGL